MKQLEIMLEELCEFFKDVQISTTVSKTSYIQHGSHEDEYEPIRAEYGKFFVASIQSKLIINRAFFGENLAEKLVNYCEKYGHPYSNIFWYTKYPCQGAGGEGKFVDKETNYKYYTKYPTRDEAIKFFSENTTNVSSIFVKLESVS